MVKCIIRLVTVGKMFVALSLLLSATLSFACDFKHVKFISNFEGAHLNACSQLDDSNFKLTIDAENRPGSSPGRGVFKQYIADTYHVHALTYEIGDNTPEHMIKHVANIAARTLMPKLVSTPVEAFEYQPLEQ